MVENDFLEIFKHTLHKLKLVDVKIRRKCRSYQERNFYLCEGVFQFSPPKQIFDVGGNKKSLIDWLHKIPYEESNCFSHRFTRINYKDGKKQKKVLKYIFDVSPKNIIDYSIDFKSKKMYLKVIGYLLVG